MSAEWRCSAVQRQVDDPAGPPVQLGVQVWEDMHPKGGEYAAYYGLYWEAANGSRFASLIEGYIRDEVGFYLDIGWALEGATHDCHHATALFYWPRPVSETHDLDSRLVELDAERAALRNRADGWKEAVLVDLLRQNSI